MKPWRFVVFCLIIQNTLFSQQINKSKHPTTTPQDLNTINTRLIDLGARVWKLENNEYSISFDPSNATGFLHLRSNNGDFYIAIKKCEPYLDGIKVVINIGNPYFANFNGFNLHVEWGSREPADLSMYLNWFNKLNKKDFSFPNILRAGAWNEVSFVIAPAQSNSFGYISFSMNTDTISLQN